ncbi:DUF1343 domain-containing protein [Parabacteroides sp. PF5-9]|uniref:exo-beta-N-acetylmuramidase NamZ family protein n=1 Tax=Parabacteroides sp. PF5-9 TaxID=1742404 RepID=UPI0024735BF2|nr:DUF1343 domain-containing protein [Parabacteroides sp. PF5-9]MDH6356777.1 uncharacterized protein YbbC (DUF1343 family) [Parabacteroides sp. PF5-9]
MKKVILSYLISCSLIVTAYAVPPKKQSLVLGAERLDVLTEILKDKRVGLVVNQTSILENQNIHLLDALLDLNVAVKKVFAPEHGFRGTAEAGEKIEDGRDQRTGLPIISIYGKNVKPTPAQLADIDVLVFDIQDVGARFYTYISTMHYVMEACAENDKMCVVLDRPNPNDFIDGPVLQKGYESFVGMHPIPLLHGLTVGELAQMINGEGWLKSKPSKCQLQVVKMENWAHGDPYWLPVKPSPNLPNDQAIRLYASLCLFEATTISIGRGTYFPFQVIGYPDQKFGTFSFTPVSLPGFDANPLQKEKECFGIDLREYPFEGGFTLRFLLDFYEKSGRDDLFFFARPQWFDQLSGTNVLRMQLISGFSEEEIRAAWQADLDLYKEMRKKYLLYADYEEAN